MILKDSGLFEFYTYAGAWWLCTLTLPIAWAFYGSAKIMQDAAGRARLCSIDCYPGHDRVGKSQHGR